MDIFQFVGKNALSLGFLLSLAVVGGSLFYSDIVGFEPCTLCWWQRVFLYPLVVIFGVGVRSGIAGVWSMVLPLTGLAGVVSLYQSYVNLGGTSLLSCTSAGGACSRLYVSEFGYINIPTMALTAIVYILLLYVFDRAYKNQ